MELNIVVRAADPARAEAVLRALGIRLERPDRPNPGRWHGRGSVSVSVEACPPDEEPTVALGFADLHQKVAGLPAGTAVHAEHDAVSLDVGGANLLVREHAGPVRRPSADKGMLLHAEVVINEGRARLKEAFARHGIRNPRLAGPELMHGRFERRFALVLDGAGKTAIDEIDGILAEHSDEAMRVEALSAEELDRDVLARVDRLAWDVFL